MTSVLLFVGGLYAQSVYFVNGSALPGGDGESWATAFNNLQDALESACDNTPAEIWVAAGTYYPLQNTDTSSTGPTDRTNTFVMCNGVSVYGGFNGDETQLEERDWLIHITTLDGDIDLDGTTAFNAYTVITFLNIDSTALLDGFFISGGYAEVSNPDMVTPLGAGGGIYIDNSFPHIRNCTIVENSALVGGGLHNLNSSPVLIQCSFIRNATTGNFGRGGGMANSGNSSPVLIDCRFESNAATSVGGGIYNINEAAVTLINGIFHNNYGTRGGGVYSNSFASANLSNCTFTENKAEFEGGGMYSNNNSKIILDSCSFINNESDGYGGGIHNSISTQSDITNCIFTGNKAYSSGGVYNSAGSNTIMTNTVLSGNSSEVDAGGILNSMSSLFLINCVVSGNMAGKDGGGIRNDRSSLKLINSTISGNSAAQNGGGLYNAGDSNPFITNSIFWNNMALGSIQAPTASIYNQPNSSTDVSYSLIANSGGSDNWNINIGADHGYNINGDPLFVTDVDIQNLPNTSGDLRLQQGSVAINSGTLDTTQLMLPNIDLDGNPRMRHGRIDMGAYEFQEDPSLPACDIEGVISVISLSTDTFFAPDGMDAYEWIIEGHAKIIGLNSQQQITIQAGAVNSYLLTLTVTGMDGIMSTCALKVTIQVDCSIYDTLEIIYVDADAIGDNDGTSWEDAFIDLQDAMLLNCPHIKEIWVAEGKYYPTQIRHDRDASIYLKNELTVLGGFSGIETSSDQRDFTNNPTIISGDINQDGFLSGNVYSVINGSGTDSTSLFDGFTITGGNADVYVGGIYSNNVGGGIFIDNGSPTISNCMISANFAGWGGGCFNNNASPVMTNCTFSDNTTNIFGGLGGGMYNGNNSSPVLNICTINNNIGHSRGGGMYNSNSSPLLINCIFSHNEVTSNMGRGGGMVNSESSPVMINCGFIENVVAGNGLGGGVCNLARSAPRITECYFTDNLAKRGGGMYNDDHSSPVVSYSTFTGNETRFEGIGGGMYNGNNSAPMLTNCTFTDNFGYDYGGGMHNENSSPVLLNCSFVNNSSFEYGGGGMSNNNSSPRLTHCLFDANRTWIFGGGMFTRGASVPLLDNCYFKDNHAGRGGGMAIAEESSPLITQCTFTSNTASVGGAGIDIDFSFPTLINCLISNNVTDGEGGGIYLSRAEASLYNCIITSNSAANLGGGIYNSFGSSPRITNSTFSGNSAGIDGGGLFNESNSYSTQVNCIIWNNRSGGSINTFSASVMNDSTSSANFSYCLIANSGGSLNWNENLGDDLGFNIDMDPLFVQDIDFGMLPDTSGDLHLLLGSPAIDAGTPDTAGLMIPVMDFDGNPRIVNGRIDMGPYEFQEIVSTPHVEIGAFRILIYPNPAFEMIYIMGYSDAKLVMITNTLGQIVAIQRGIHQDCGTGYPIDVSHLKQGAYVAYLLNGEGKETFQGVGKFSIVR